MTEESAPRWRRRALRWALTVLVVGVVGFGLSNDERRGVTVDFAPAFAIAGVVKAQQQIGLEEHLR